MRMPAKGGADAGAKYNYVEAERWTSQTETATLAPGKFVYPVAMSVDSSDEQAPEKYAIYVLDLVNPQALSQGPPRARPLVLQYRLQKLENVGSTDAAHAVASVSFTLTSSATTPYLHATSMAVDGAAHRVYVLISDAPPTSDNENNRLSYASYAVDAWTTGTGSAPGEKALAPAVGLEDKLGEDKLDGGGELLGPNASVHLQGTSTSSVAGDVEGDSLVLDGSGPGAPIALAGNEYTAPLSAGVQIEPIVKTFAPGVQQGEHAGEAGPQWGGAGNASEVAETENPVAAALAQKSEALYSASSNPDGSLSLTFGQRRTGAFLLNPDGEPNMAKVVLGTNHTETSPILPWAVAAEDAKASGKENLDGSATSGFALDLPTYAKEQNFGTSNMATAFTSGLGPSVVELAGGGSSQFPGDLYAGIVANRAGSSSSDPQRPPSAPGSYTWKGELASRQTIGGQEEWVVTSPASFGIRVFDAQGQSLAMIGNATPGGPCNLQGGSHLGYSAGEGSSFAALAAGREGVVFALVQPDLESRVLQRRITPEAPIDAGMGDQVIELKPGVTGEAQECPQPEGNFSIADESTHSQPVTGSGPVNVVVNSKLKF
ncbi:MAG: hypothetical protein FWD17_20115, partial [Polyangiaceae bacterium]|nr:hypothetical protein [Polyangiaceae bacterium]